MKRIYLIISVCIATSMLQAQELSGQYTTEWQWDMNKNTNWVNQLRLDLSVPLGNDRNTIKAATLHLAQTGEDVAEGEAAGAEQPDEPGRLVRHLPPAEHEGDRQQPAQARQPDRRIDPEQAAQIELAEGAGIEAAPQ